MKNHISTTKLITHFQLLSLEEFKLLTKWLQSPWANSNKKLIELYDLLKRHYPTFEAKSLTKENLFARLYPGKKYDDKWMRNILAGMSKQVEKFLIHSQVERDEILKKRLLSSEYLERNYNSWYIKQAEELIQLIESKEVKETDDYLMLALVHEELYRQPKMHQSSAGSGSLLQVTDLYLDTFYCISKWRILTEMLERNMILKEKIELKEKLERLSFITRSFDIPVINIYKQRINFGNELTVDDFLVLKNQFYSDFKRLPIWDRKLLIYYLINNIIRLWLKGNKGLMIELFKLYKFGIESSLLFNYGHITRNTYSNIVTTANSLGEFEYANYFIDNYSDALPTETKESTRVWAIGHTLHKQGRLKDAIELLSSHHYNNDEFSLTMKALLLECYFDASLTDSTYVEFLDNYCEAYKKYAKRNRVKSESRKIAWINMAKYTQKLSNIVHFNSANKNEIESLKMAIESEGFLQSRQWLIEKIEQFK